MALVAPRWPRWIAAGGAIAARALGPTLTAALALADPSSASPSAAAEVDVTTHTSLEAVEAVEADDGGAEGVEGVGVEALAGGAWPTRATGGDGRARGPPRFMRASLYHYTFAPPPYDHPLANLSQREPPFAGRRPKRGSWPKRSGAAGKLASRTVEGAWWARRRVGTYLPAVELANPSLQQFIVSAGWGLDAGYRCGLRLRSLPSPTSTSAAREDRELGWCTSDGCVAHESLQAARSACARLSSGCDGIALVAATRPMPPSLSEGGDAAREQIRRAGGSPATTGGSRSTVAGSQATSGVGVASLMRFETRVGSPGVSTAGTAQRAIRESIARWVVAAPSASCPSAGAWARSLLRWVRAYDQEVALAIVAVSLVGSPLLRGLRGAWRALAVLLTLLAGLCQRQGRQKRGPTRRLADGRRIRGEKEA